MDQRFMDCSQQQHNTEESKYYDKVTCDLSTEDTFYMPINTEEITNGNFHGETVKQDAIKDSVVETENYLEKKFIENSEYQYHERGDKDLETCDFPVEHFSPANINANGFNDKCKEGKTAQNTLELWNLENNEISMLDTTERLSNQLTSSEESCISDVSRELFQLSEIEVQTSDTLHCTFPPSISDISNGDCETTLNKSSPSTEHKLSENSIYNELTHSIESTEITCKEDVGQKSHRRNITSEPLIKYMHSFDFTPHRLSLPLPRLTRAPFFPDVTDSGYDTSMDVKCEELTFGSDNNNSNDEAMACIAETSNDFITIRKKSMNTIVEECEVQNVGVVETELSLSRNEDYLQSCHKEKHIDTALDVQQSTQESKLSECRERMKSQYQEQDFLSSKILDNIVLSNTAYKIDDKNGQLNDNVKNATPDSEMMEKLFGMEDDTVDTASSLICRQNTLVQSLNFSPLKPVITPRKNRRRHTLQSVDLKNFDYKKEDQNCEELKENIPETNFVSIRQKREIVPRRSSICSGTHDFSSLEQFYELNRQYNSWRKILFPEKPKKYMLRSQTKVLKESNAGDSFDTSAILQTKPNASKSKRRHSDRYFLRPLKMSPNEKTQNDDIPGKVPLTESRKKFAQCNFESRKSPKAPVRMIFSRMPPTPPQKKFTHCKERVPLYRTNRFQNVVSPIKKDLMEHPPPPLMQTVLPRKPLKRNDSSKIANSLCEIINENEQSDSNVGKPMEMEFSPVQSSVNVVNKPDLLSINDRDWAKLTRAHTIENKKKKTLYFPSLYKPTISRHKGVNKALHWAECLTSDKSLKSSPSHVPTVAKPILVKREIIPLDSIDLDEDFEDLSLIEQVSVQYTNTLSSI